MTCGTPTVVANVSSLPEVVGDAALLVAPNDTEELTVALWRLLTDDQLCVELQQKGFKRTSASPGHVQPVKPTPSTSASVQRSRCLCHPHARSLEVA